jgi:hypothetical protein
VDDFIRGCVRSTLDSRRKFWLDCSQTKAATRRSAPRAGRDNRQRRVSFNYTFNQAIDGVIQNNQKARQNPKALAKLDAYKRPLVGSLSANLQRFGMERVAKVESLQKIIAEMSGTGDNPAASQRTIKGQNVTDMR